MEPGDLLQVADDGLTVVAFDGDTIGFLDEGDYVMIIVGDPSPSPNCVKTLSRLGPGWVNAEGLVEEELRRIDDDD